MNYTPDTDWDAARAPLPPVKNPASGMEIAGMVLGITGWAISVLSFGFLWIVGLILWIIGLPLSIKGKDGAQSVGLGHGMATAGIWTSIVGISISGLFIGLGIITFIAAAVMSA